MSFPLFDLGLVELVTLSYFPTVFRSTDHTAWPVFSSMSLMTSRLWALEGQRFHFPTVTALGSSAVPSTRDTRLLSVKGQLLACCVDPRVLLELGRHSLGLQVPWGLCCCHRLHPRQGQIGQAARPEGAGHKQRRLDLLFSVTRSPCMSLPSVEK